MQTLSSGSHHGKQPYYLVSLPYRDTRSLERLLHGSASRNAAVRESGDGLQNLLGCAPSSEVAPARVVTPLGTAGQGLGAGRPLSWTTVSEGMGGGVERQREAWAPWTLLSVALQKRHASQDPFPSSENPFQHAQQRFQQKMLQGKRSINKTKVSWGMWVEGRGPNQGGELILLWFTEKALSPNNLCSEPGSAG